MRAILRTRQIAGGPFVRQLERLLCRVAGASGAVATSSGTSALHLALLSLDIGNGDNVLLPSYTCPAVAQAVAMAGATPRFVDIDPETLNITAALTRRRVTRRTRAVIVTHTFGFPAAVDEIESLGIPVIEDCATAVGATYRRQPTGSHGAMAVFSFYATKMVGAGHGGAVSTARRDLIRRIRNFNGVDRPSLTPVRFNYLMSDLTAGLACAQLRRLRTIARRRRNLALRYATALDPWRLQQPVSDSRPVYYRFAVRSDNPSASIRRARRLGISVDRPVAWPLHRLANESREAFSGTEDAYRTLVSIPLYPALRQHEVELIARSLPEIFG